MATAQASPRAEVRRRARRGVRPVPLLVGFAVLGGLGYWGWAKTHPADDITGKLITAVASKGDLQETVTATGSVTAQTGAEVKIGSQITGTIKHLYADVGSTVKAGQLIAELNLPDIQAQLNQAQANLQAADTKYIQQKSGVGMERTQTASAIAQAQAAFRSAQAKLAAAQAAANQQTAQTPTDIKRAQTVLAAAQAALSTARSNLAQTQAGADL